MCKKPKKLKAEIKYTYYILWVIIFILTYFKLLLDARIHFDDHTNQSFQKSFMYIFCSVTGNSVHITATYQIKKQEVTASNWTVRWDCKGEVYSLYV